VWEYTRGLALTSVEFSKLMPAAFRLFAIAGHLEEAKRLRRDLMGELEEAALVLYERQDYDLAAEYISQVLDEDPTNWRMRMYRTRVLIRKDRWDEADSAIEQLLTERPTDHGALHLKGWRLMRQRRYPEAAGVLAKVVARREHVASLRDLAESVHQMGHNEEALRFLQRAKQVETDNPFVLDLEAQILQEMNRFSEAYDAAFLAMLRDPNNWSFHHRLGMISTSLGDYDKAVKHLGRSVELDPERFAPGSALVAALLDSGNLLNAEASVRDLEQKVHTPANRAVFRNLKARLLWRKGQLVEAADLLAGCG